MTNIDLTDQQLQTLLVFLNRVQLQGSEVPAFVDLINVINKAREFVTKNQTNYTKEVNIDDEKDNYKRDKSRPAPTKGAEN